MDSSQFVTPGFGLVFWTAITFVFLLFILRKFAWKPILGAVSQREESIKKALEAAELAKKQVENIGASNEKLLKEARTERELMLKEAREIKEKMVVNAKLQASEEADKIIKQAQETIKSEKQAAVTELKKQVASLSISIAEKIVQSELSSKDKQLHLVEKMIKESSLN